MNARVQSLAFRGWWEERATAAREARRYARIFGRNAASVAGLGLVVAFLLIALVGPWIVPYPEDATGTVHLDRKLEAPSRAHWFGTDEVGDDVYTRVVLGARLSLQIGLVITLVAATIGVPLGVVAGYVRLVQGKALAISQESYVEAARAVGVGRLRIAFVHLLPNCLSPILVKASMDMGTAILTAASLGFIGLGAQPPFPEWGAMISHGRNYLPTWWWYSAFPGLAIYLTVLGFNLLGDGLRDVLDPKSQS
ncbi:MAG: D-ala-D-ala transporter subunit [Candidatus Rokubacteria bacterium 13_1_20CM_4_68_9]|nr:MAG: D-ala-D-ala transporter subunit [Candidatus Rokubacteria bacterium 13_1_20CM_4_68_9]